MKYDFGGYATKNDIRCTDGRTIRQDAFKHQDGTKVPLVWQHKHDTPSNVLGHAILENREDGVYVYGKFNDTESGQNARELVHNGDVDALSIYANQLVQKTMDVVHGFINEVSLVLAGANPGAMIDNLNISHGNGQYEIVEDEAVIYNGINLESDDDLEHSDDSTIEDVLDTLNDEQREVVDFLISEALTHSADAADDTVSHAANEDMSLQEVFDTLSEQQKTAVYAMIGYAIEESMSHSAETDPQNNDSLEHSTEGGTKIMKRNVFDKTEVAVAKNTLTHAQIKAIVDDAQKTGSFADSFLAHAGTYGIDNIDYLFPDAKLLNGEPDFISRRMGWVASVLTDTHHSPFSRIKTVHADITATEARAKGYVTGNEKIEEVFGLLKRVTTPTTVYKKQKLDRDDILDITDLNVVSWLKAEMRIMLDEEVARAILIGDGRSVASDDKIKEENIRPIYTDADLYAVKLQLAVASTTTAIVEAIIASRKLYKGSGTPTFYTTTDFVTDMLLLKDTTGRRIYKSVAEIAEDLRVAKIVEVEVMEGITRDVLTKTYNLVGIIVNLKDYNVGADKGGEIGMFDDFDIDFNQYKYLIETRMSGALTKPKSAIVVEIEQA